jgi:hypothetical protein
VAASSVPAHPSQLEGQDIVIDGSTYKVLKVTLSQGTVKLQSQDLQISIVSFNDLMRTDYRCVELRDHSWGCSPFVFSGQQTTAHRIECSISPYQFACDVLKSGILLDKIDINSDPFTALTKFEHNNGMSGMHVPLHSQRDHQ